MSIIYLPVDMPEGINIRTQQPKIRGRVWTICIPKELKDHPITWFYGRVIEPKPNENNKPKIKRCSNCQQINNIDAVICAFCQSNKLFFE